MRLSLRTAFAGLLIASFALAGRAPSAEVLERGHGHLSAPGDEHGQPPLSDAFESEKTETETETRASEDGCPQWDLPLPHTAVGFLDFAPSSSIGTPLDSVAAHAARGPPAA